MVATSRYGEEASPELLERISQDAAIRGGVALLFGGPRRGLLDYTSRELYDLVVNMIPMQGVETVRTEEALYSCLSLINAYLHFTLK